MKMKKKTDLATKMQGFSKSLKDKFIFLCPAKDEN